MPFRGPELDSFILRNAVEEILEIGTELRRPTRRNDGVVELKVFQGGGGI